MNSETIKERIHKTTEIKENGCWIWTGYKNVNGYGMMNMGGPRPFLVHRVMYEAYEGSIPEGLVLDHICHTPSCVNPVHLRAVTQTVNIQNRKGATKKNKIKLLNITLVADGYLRVQVVRNKKTYYLGRFKNLEEAIKVRNEFLTQERKNNDTAPTNNEII